MNEMDESSRRVAVWTILLRFLRLGCTHLGYFREEFVLRLRWLEETTFAEIVGLCQFLPGPASSQVGFTIGLMAGGLPGGLAAWIGFTLPSAMLMVAFAYGYALLQGSIGLGLLHGLELAAVAVVAQAVWGMRRALAPEGRRLVIAALGAVVVLWAPVVGSQLMALGSGAMAGWWFCRGSLGVMGDWPVAVSRRVSVAAAGMFVGLLLGLPVWVVVRPVASVELFNAFYRAGALVFGGGHVVLPLLQSATVARGWVDQGTFLAGYGGAQALPGPLFSFAAFLGSVCRPVPGVGGAAISLVGIFLPGLLLIVAVMPWWGRIRESARMQAVIAGVNASVVGILFGALCRPVWTSAVGTVWDGLIVVAAFAALVVGRVRPLVVVGVVALMGSVGGVR